MTIDRRTLLSAGLTSGLIATSAGAVHATTPQEVMGLPDTTEYIDLWPKGPAGRLNPALTETSPASGEPAMRRTSGIVNPRMAVYRPKTPNGSAMLIIPGGGYRIVSIDNEGHYIARYLAAAGITAFVLFYRLPNEGWANQADVPLTDAQRAMRLIRARAKTYNLDPQKVGAMGFSAGGHLCCSLATRYAASVYTAVDEADALDARPVLFAPVYPVVSMRPGITHTGSRDNLIGATAEEAKLALYSTDEQVTTQTPPAFIVHAEDDKTVPVENSLRLRAALRKVGVTVETHLYPEGGHGFGLRNPKAQWGELFLNFARGRGLFNG
ncbi:alpha/beta hydrolase [Asticcacaulis sp. BYS171W]|uniref:Alpha/beta hydrolase n=1 Tax=Asticcacaulis aquaticus TaxID=2984212 RepID=A0ABT5HR11_9CAUL|nr:alpha/beta hydrolase [Asticcacaulis aquaticus]MDC7682419.1 alpha/beta hydrolase [Asticcacaulis aquaticus]